MSSFDIESTFRRFLILGAGGVVAIVAVFLIVRYGSKIPTDSGSAAAVADQADQANVRDTPPSAARAKVKPPRATSHDASDTITESSPSASPLAPDSVSPAAVEADVDSSPTLPGAKRPVRVIFVASNAAQPVKPEDGALFPKEHCRVQIHHLDSEPGSRLTGINSKNNYYYGGVDETQYFQNQLRLRGLILYSRNGLLRASGQLTAPVLLTFSNPDSSPQPDLLLWPMGCQVNLSAQCDTNGNVTISGGSRFLDAFAHLVNSRSNAAVKLTLATQTGGCATNVPVQGAAYTLNCVVSNRMHTQETLAEVQVELAAVNAFQKMFQANRSVAGQSPFWQALDEQCQMFTQGRLGVTGYEFSGSDDARESARQAVLADLAAAPIVSLATKKLIGNTLTSANLSVMASIPDRSAWDKSLPLIAAELAAQNSKVRSALGSGMPNVSGLFAYYSSADASGGAPVVLARLDFSTAPPPVYEQQLAQLNAAIAELEKKLSTPGLTPAAKSQLRTQLATLQNRKATLFVEDGFTR